MNAKRSWTGKAAAAAMAVAMALATSAAIAAPAAAEVRLIVPSATSLLRFYPAQLISTPDGDVEDQEVWLAKVQGLLAVAPPLLQQSLLNSQTTEEFASNLALLEQMQEGRLKRSALALQSQAKGGQFATKGLGDANNLVYKSLEPCRIMDSRHATSGSGVQGPIVGGILYSIPGFITAGTNWSAYGQTTLPLSDCGLNSTVGSNIKAIAIVITILNPNFDAFLGVGDTGVLATILSKVALNYAHGQGLSTMYVVPQGQSNIIYFAMPAGLSAQLIFDVVGYYAVSDATALDCTTAVVQTTLFFPPSSVDLPYPSCPSGYSRTGVYCAKSIYAATAQLSVINGTDSCYWSGGEDTGDIVEAISICCRVPGK